MANNSLILPKSKFPNIVSATTISHEDGASEAGYTNVTEYKSSIPWFVNGIFPFGKKCPAYGIMRSIKYIQVSTSNVENMTVDIYVLYTD